MKRLRERGTQTYDEFDDQTKKEMYGMLLPHRNFFSYSRFQKESKKTNFRWLLNNVINSKEAAIKWCQDNKLLAKGLVCDICNHQMELKKSTNYSSDGYKWRCRKNGSTHDRSLRKGSWFENCNMTLEEVIEMTYWWSAGMTQQQIQQEMRMSSKTSVDWFNFYRELCDHVMMDKSQPIGGPGKRVQIDESKFGKRKYHRGHHVEGQWVFGGIEEESRRNFMVAVEKRDRNTLIPIIEKYILPGTTIISDCWKPYDILSEKDFTHLKVNHSVEFVNEEGDHTNKIEGHWQQAKSKFPAFGIRKSMFNSYLGEFMWRYSNKENDLFKEIIKDISSVYRFK